MTTSYASARHAAREKAHAEKVAEVKRLAAEDFSPKEIAVRTQLRKQDVKAILSS